MNTDEKEVKEIYEKYGEYFEQAVLKDPERQNLSKVLHSMTGNIKGKQILDAGCGAGFDAEYFARNGAKVLAVDISEKMLDIARKRCEGLDVEFQLKDIENLESDRQFDIILVAFTLLYKENFKNFLKKFYQILKPDGELFIVLPHPVRKMTKYTNNYFERGKRWEEHEGMKWFNYYRTMENYFNALITENFVIQEIKEIEPIAKEEIIYPIFLIIKASKKV